jgi:hypothetical protein
MRKETDEMQVQHTLTTHVRLAYTGIVFYTGIAV